jgi:multisubunit Na+/H+ antiporter MnhG subunit
LSVSKQIAGILGPSIAVVTATEFPLVQPGLYEQQTPPVVYLSGLLFFVAGLAIVRAHNLWNWNWQTLVTLSGWGLLLLGVIRLFGATAYQRAAGTAESWGFMAVEVALFCVGLYLTFKAYTRSP